MTKKKTPQTIEECNAEMERTQKQIRQYENREKMLDRKLTIEKRKERNHRLCSRGGYMESITPELIDMTDEEAKAFLRLKAYASGLITLPEDMMAADSGAENEETEDMDDEA